MKKHLVISVVWILICFVAYAAGRYTGLNSSVHHARASYISAQNALAGYLSEASMAEKLENKKYNEALCSVNITASAWVYKVRECLADTVCRSYIEEDVTKMAPELLGKGDLKMKYYKPGELCKP